MRRLVVIGAVVSMALTGCTGNSSGSEGSGAEATPRAGHSAEAGSEAPEADGRESEGPDRTGAETEGSETEGSGADGPEAEGVEAESGGDRTSGDLGSDQDTSDQAMNLHRYLLLNSPDYQAISFMPCVGPDVPYTDPACGSQIKEASRVMGLAVELVNSSEQDQARYAKALDTARTYQKNFRLLRDMGCFGLGPAPDAGSNEAELCTSLGPLAGVLWLGFQSNLDTF